MFLSHLKNSKFVCIKLQLSATRDNTGKKSFKLKLFGSALITLNTRGNGEMLRSGYNVHGAVDCLCFSCFCSLPYHPFGKLMASML